MLLLVENMSHRVAKITFIESPHTRMDEETN